MEVEFKDLKNSDLIIDCLYKGGTAGNLGDEPLHHIFPKLGNQSGFRKVKRNDDPTKYAYVVLYTTMSELEWPDYLDEETGVFRYYGDNRKPNNPLLQTKQGGNRLLEEVFATLNSGKNLENIPPFFVFKKDKKGRDVRFVGLAAPGNPYISPDKDLVAFWRTLDNKNFHNYESYFTILNTGDEPISHKWLEALCTDYQNSFQYAPEAWKSFVSKGREGIMPLTTSRSFKIPTRYEQLQSDIEGAKCLEIIRQHYKEQPANFEVCAANIIEKMDKNFVDFSLTRPWRDGGHDAVGHYCISTGGKVNPALKMDCALETNCCEIENSVDSKQVSRLISRTQYRDFGILITTSYIDSKAYEKVVNYGHPILIVTASDIAKILRINDIDSNNINQWLLNVEKNKVNYQDKGRYAAF